MTTFFSKLYLYIFREVFFSFLISFLIFFTIFLINQILVSVKDLMQNHVAFLDVIQLVLYYIPQLIYLSAPFASLGAVVLAMGRLSSDNEILAIQASGISRHLIFFPVLILGVFLTIGSFVVNDVLMPLGSIQQRKLFVDIAVNNAQLEFPAYSVKKIANQTVVTGEVNGKELIKPILINRSPDQKNQIISADRALFSKGNDRRTLLSLDLSGIKSLTPDNKSQGSFESFTAEKMLYNIFSKDMDISTAPPSPAEMSMIDVLKRIGQMEAVQNLKEKEKNNSSAILRFEIENSFQSSLENIQNGVVDQGILEKNIVPILENLKVEENKINKDWVLLNFQIQFYQKFTLPLGCVELTLLGFSIGIFNRRRGRASSLVLGVGMAFFYWMLLFVAQFVSQQYWLAVPLSMFLPNILLMIAGLILYWTRRNS